MLITQLQIGIDAFEFPTVDGTSGQIMQTDGVGNLTWIDPATAGVWDRDSSGFLSPTTDGDDLRIYDGSGTDYINVAHDGSDAIIETNTGNIIFNSIIEATVAFSGSGLSSDNVEDAIMEIDAKIGAAGQWESVSGGGIQPLITDANLHLGSGDVLTTGYITNGSNYLTVADIQLAFAHVDSSGASHSYIDQDVTSGSSPTLDNTNISGNISVFTNDAGYITSFDDFWNRTSGGTITTDTGTDTLDLEGGWLGFTLGTTINEISIDGLMLGNSDNAVPTEKAVKQYVDDNIPAVTGYWDRPSGWSDVLETSPAYDRVGLGYFDFSTWTRTQFLSAHADTSTAGSSHNIGVAGESMCASGYPASGIYGRAMTMSSLTAYGIYGRGIVNDTGNTGDAVGVSGVAIDTHAGGDNIGVFGYAENGANNWSFMGIGDIKNLGDLIIVSTASGANPALEVSVTDGTLTLENDAQIANKKNINVDTGVNVIDSFSDLTGEGCIWHLLCIKDGNRRVGTFMATWSASTNDIEYANVSTKDIGTVDLSFTTDISSDNVRLLATATSDDWEVRVIRQLI